MPVASDKIVIFPPKLGSVYEPPAAGGVKVPEGFVYSSDNNAHWMSVEELRTWIDANRDKMGKI